MLIFLQNCKQNLAKSVRKQAVKSWVAHISKWGQIWAYVHRTNKMRIIEHVHLSFLEKMSHFIGLSRSNNLQCRDKGSRSHHCHKDSNYKPGPNALGKMPRSICNNYLTLLFLSESTRPEKWCNWFKNTLVQRELTNDVN